MMICWVMIKMYCFTYRVQNWVPWAGCGMPGWLWVAKELMGEVPWLV
jgi:hypothetical protein